MNKVNRYATSEVGNHHFSKKVFEDSQRLLTRCNMLGVKTHRIPNDASLMMYFGWTKDHLDRCYQLLKSVGVVDYAKGHRRSTLHFIGEYEYLNAYLQ